MALQGLCSKDLDKFDVQPYCLHSSPGKEHQHEVMEEGSTEPTQHRNTSHMTSNQEEDVQTSKRQTHVHDDKTVSIASQFPIVQSYNNDAIAMIRMADLLRT